MYCSRDCANSARRGVKMSKGHKTEIIKLARGGATTHMIMERLNIPKGTVAYHLTRAREEGVNLPNVPTGARAHRPRQRGRDSDE
jgi:transposase